ncbi:unnamed protein product [Toxocara canis]|uniref:Uncharacterized protein n=1 Tax=Toxocara canis TaxID=6265 RepID=A0A183U187_TOXCA|nr:unnamed protein product [Toxocara canis]
MYCNSAHSLVPEVITLSDSDDEDDSMREVQKAAATSATASVSIVHERPLSPSAFLFPSQQTSLSCRTPLANCSATTECALGMNDIALRSSHLRSSKRLAQDHQDVVAAKRSAVADNSQRRPLQQSAQIVPSVRPTFAYDVVSSTPSTSNSRLRQPSVQDHATNGEPNRNIRASMMVRGHSAVPYSQQNSRPVSQQRYKTAEPQNSCSSQVQRNKLLASSQPISRQQPTAQRRTTPINSASSWHPVTQRTTTLNSYCYESFDPKAPPFEAQTFSARFKVGSPSGFELLLCSS